MTNRYHGHVVIRQGERQTSADATIVVGAEDDGGGWEITVYRPDETAADLDPTRLMQVCLPTGEAGRFVEWLRRGNDRLGVGVGRPPAFSQL